MAIINVLNASTVRGNAAIDGSDGRTTMIPCTHASFGDVSSIPDSSTRTIDLNGEKEYWLHAIASGGSVSSRYVKFYFNDSSGSKGYIQVSVSNAKMKVEYCDALNYVRETHTFSNSSMRTFDFHVNEQGITIYADGNEVTTWAKNVIGFGTTHISVFRATSCHVGEIIVADSDTRGFRLATSAPDALGDISEMDGDLANVQGTAVTKEGFNTSVPAIQTFKHTDPLNGVVGDLSIKAVVMSNVITATADTDAPRLSPVVTDGTDTEELKWPLYAHVDLTPGPILTVSETNPLTGQPWSVSDVAGLSFGLKADFDASLFNMGNFGAGVGFDNNADKISGNSAWRGFGWKEFQINSTGGGYIKNLGNNVVEDPDGAVHTYMRVYLGTEDGMTYSDVFTQSGGSFYMRSSGSSSLKAFFDKIKAQPQKVLLWYETWK
ncbi:hypothetical protein SM033_00038 [Vibrio phage vB_VpaM_sm033]|nr:hypothetical protein SM033_00038 [Vibrio phage vB_VpaM_sm033]